MRTGARLGFALCLSVSAVGAQQEADTTFHPVIARPAWTADKGPRLCLDEGHHNFHTLAGRFLAFGELARRDGYRVSPLRSTFTGSALAGCDLLVIANAQPNDDPWTAYPLPTPSAFTPSEVRELQGWVRRGGAMLLLADHMPLAGAAMRLAEAFGVTFTNGFAVERYDGESARDSAFAIPTLFRTNDGTLASHAVLAGRDSTERVTRVRSFTGQAFRAAGTAVTPIMILPATFISLQPKIAWQFGPETPRIPVGGWMQGASLTDGRGRVAIFGEAGMFSAQLTSAAHKPMGMNAPLAEQNAQFVLNVLHWLSGVIGR